MEESFQYKLTASTRFFMPKRQLAEYINDLIRFNTGKGTYLHALNHYVDILVDEENPTIRWILETVTNMQILFVCSSVRITGHELDGTEDTNYPFHSKSGENMTLFHYVSFLEKEDWWITKIDTEQIQHKTYGIYKNGRKKPVFCYIDLEQLINRDDVYLDKTHMFEKLNTIPELKQLFK